MRKNLESKFNKPEMVKNTDLKYSELMDKYVSAFAGDFVNFNDPNDIIDFGLNAWNLANIKADLPKVESEKVLDAFNDEDEDTILLKNMIDYKIQHFSKYTNFIVDFELKETTSDPVLSITTMEKEPYLAKMVADMDDDQDEEANFDQGYINRCGIVISPLQPFLDWLKRLDSGVEIAANESNIYLVEEEIDDLDEYLLENFDEFFQMELANWDLEEAKWPQKRSFKMFKEWFHISLSTMVYDLEEYPINKS